MAGLDLTTQDDDLIANLLGQEELPTSIEPAHTQAMTEAIQRDFPDVDEDLVVQICAWAIPRMMVLANTTGQARADLRAAERFLDAEGLGDAYRRVRRATRK